MPQGRRTFDQAKGARPRHWLAVQASRHPVGMALIVAIAVAMIPLVMVLRQQATIRRQQASLDKVVLRVNRDRAEVSGAFCRTLNTNARANNNQTKALEGIIVRSVTASKPFERVYKSLGLPPYSVRLKQARKIAALLHRSRVPLADCEAYVRRIEGITGSQPKSRGHVPLGRKYNG